MVKTADLDPENVLGYPPKWPLIFFASLANLAMWGALSFVLLLPIRDLKVQLFDEGFRGPKRCFIYTLSKA